MLSISGALDRSYGSGGTALAPVGSPYMAAATLVDSAGRVVVVGDSWADSSVAITRFNADGTPDASFGTGGTIAPTFSADGPDQLYAAAIQPDGKILVAGSFESEFGLARFNADGSLDRSFGTGGVVMTAISGDASSTSPDVICGLVVEADGKILVAGDTDSSIALARYNANGSLDGTFGRRGIAITAPPAGSDFVEDDGLAILPNGEILVVGDGGTSDRNTAYDVFAYYRGNGTLLALDRGPNDPNSFGPMGFTVRPDGSIVTAEGTWDVISSRQTGGVLEWHLPDGSLDTSFGSGGRVTLAMNGVSGLATAPDGKLLVLGAGYYGSILARYDASGAADPKFGVEGRMIVSKADLAGGVAIGPGGSIFASGIALSSGAFSVTKFSPDVGVNVPTATLSGHDLTAPGQNQVPITVTYSPDVDPSTLGDDDLSVGDAFFPEAAFDGYTRNADGSIAASYVLEVGLGRDFTPNYNGAYAITVNEGAVLTTAGVAVPGQTLETVTVAIPPAPAGLQPPTATLAASDITAPATMAAQFTVTYRSDAGIDPATIRDALYVQGPHGAFSALAPSLVSTTQNADGSVTVTYSMSKYTGSQSLPADNGDYTIGVNGDDLFDTYGNPLAAQTLGTIHVNVPPPPEGAAAPTATLDSVDTSQDNTTLLTVTYRGSDPIAPATINGGDLTVQDGHGNTWSLTVQSTQSNADGSVTATYAFTPFTRAADGSIVLGSADVVDRSQGSGDTVSLRTCTLSVNGVQVSDVQGSTVAAGAIGTFQALVPDSPQSVVSLGNSLITPIARTSPGLRFTETAHRHHHHRYRHAHARHRHTSAVSATTKTTTTKHGARTAAGHVG